MPAVAGMSRVTQKDMVLAGYQIPEGKDNVLILFV